MFLTNRAALLLLLGALLAVVRVSLVAARAEPLLGEGARVAPWTVDIRVQKEEAEGMPAAGNSLVVPVEVLIGNLEAGPVVEYRKEQAEAAARPYIQLAVVVAELSIAVLVAVGSDRIRNRS